MQCSSIMKRRVERVSPDAHVEAAAPQMCDDDHKSRILRIDMLGHLAGILRLSDLAQTQIAAPIVGDDA